ncbi:hypothetical protein [Rhodoferax antarcticus]|uniref:hypothetical protein n=1 Tax=Rhodoferax antarcticus TaxID=81479 RepID=UPI00222509BE|nr:hypothetical protein [Rhodoferax antarcticus]MCW2313970.1 hypothetical protein [Rhodoferax antarcticus]
MTPAELTQHKAAPKRLASAPAFTKLKRGKLPKPFNKMGGGERWHSTGEIKVSESHRIFAFWRDGEELTDRAFFAWLMCELQNGGLYPLFEFHYHPSHKGVHAKLPCKTELDYTNRQLPQAPEFELACPGEIDPRTEEGRLRLMHRFCQACGIAQGREGGLWNSLPT